MDQADAQFQFVLNQSTNNIPALLGKSHMIITYFKSLILSQHEIKIHPVYLIQASLNIS